MRLFTFISIIMVYINKSNLESIHLENTEWAYKPFKVHISYVSGRVVEYASFKEKEPAELLVKELVEKFNSKYDLIKIQD